MKHMDFSSELEAELCRLQCAVSNHSDCTKKSHKTTHVPSTSQFTLHTRRQQLLLSACSTSDLHRTLATEFPSAKRMRMAQRPAEFGGQWAGDYGMCQINSGNIYFHCFICFLLSPEYWTPFGIEFTQPLVSEKLSAHVFNAFEIELESILFSNVP